MQIGRYNYFHAEMKAQRKQDDDIVSACRSPETRKTKRDQIEKKVKTGIRLMRVRYLL